jgi:trehalose synthase-fused probable maltokinase
MEDRASFRSLTTLTIDAAWSWDAVLAGPERTRLATAMAAVLPTRRWFGAKTRTIRELEILEAIPISDLGRLLVVRAAFESGPEEIYQVPLGYMANGSEGSITAAARWIIVEHDHGHVEGVLYDALGDANFCQQLLELLDEPVELIGASGKIEVEHTGQYDALRGKRRSDLSARLLAGEQSNSSVVFGDRLIMKLFRRVETGLNPDFELSEFLTEAGFRNTPAVAGAIVYRQGDETWALAMLQAFVPNRGDAWKFTLDWLNRPVAEFATTAASGTVPALPTASYLRTAEQGISAEARASFGEFLHSAARLGQRTAEMHLALASDKQRDQFAPEPFTNADRAAYLKNCLEYARATFALLRQQQPKFSGDLAAQAARVAALETKALEFYASLENSPLDVDKIRIHGDYHLGQVLATSDDFQIIDFEGEPVRSIAERRQKQLALRDVAGILRSFHYASRTAAAQGLKELAAMGQGDWAASAAINDWAASWYAWTCVAFLSDYLKIARGASFLPRDLAQTEQLLGVCLLEKAIYELRYELNNRPDWVYLPLAALEGLLRN